AGSYFVLLMTGFVLGSVGRRFVWACRLDTTIPYLRLKHEWFYVLQGRHKGAPRQVLSYVDVLTRLPDKDGSQTRLFRGVVIDFEIAPSGSLDSLTLQNAVRGSGRGNEFQWKPIPSSRLIIVGNTIHSINVTYFGVDSADEASRLGRLRTWLRSFMLEEP